MALGYMIPKKEIKAWGGELKISSDLSKGTTVSLIIPKLSKTVQDASLEVKKLFSLMMIL